MVLTFCLTVFSFFPSAFAQIKSAEVLIVGDSLTCGPFGKDLMKDLAAKGKKVSLFCAPGSAPQDWVDPDSSSAKCTTMTSSDPKPAPCNGDGTLPAFDKLLAKFRGAHVIVALGANSVYSGDTSADSSYSQMAKMLKAGENSCDWIGPPHARSDQIPDLTAEQKAALNLKQLQQAEKALQHRREAYAAGDRSLNDFYDSLESATSNCAQLNSRTSSAPGTAGNNTVDGIHVDEKTGAYRASQIMAQIYPSTGEANAAPTNGVTEPSH